MRIELTDIRVEFRGRGLPALDGVHLRIEHGERVALLGPSGSGKTTLLRVVLGAIPLAAGTVQVGGHDPYGRRAETRSIRTGTGIVRQRDDLVRTLTARTNALAATTPSWSLADWAGVLSGRVPARYRDRLRELAVRHGIQDHLDARVEQLSGGQRQRVALVRALLPDARLLLADEPTAALDPHTAATAIDALLGVDGATVVVATHDLAVAARFSRTVALRHGRVVFDGTQLGEREIDRIYRTGATDGPLSAAGDTIGPVATAS
jgi:ABC-type phosphate/phosphonate transport system ATPase subunit